MIYVNIKDITLDPLGLEELEYGEDLRA